MTNAARCGGARNIATMRLYDALDVTALELFDDLFARARQRQILF